MGFRIYQHVLVYGSILTVACGGAGLYAYYYTTPEEERMKQLPEGRRVFEKKTETEKQKNFQTFLTQLDQLNRQNQKDSENMFKNWDFFSLFKRKERPPVNELEERLDHLLKSGKHKKYDPNFGKYNKEEEVEEKPVVKKE